MLDGRRRNGRNKRSHQTSYGLGLRAGDGFSPPVKLTTDGVRRRIEWLRDHTDELRRLRIAESEY